MNFSSKGKMTANPSCHNSHDARYEAESFSIFSTEYVKNDLVERSGSIWRAPAVSCEPSVCHDGRATYSLALFQLGLQCQAVRVQGHCAPVRHLMDPALSQVLLSLVQGCQLTEAFIGR